MPDTHLSEDSTHASLISNDILAPYGSSLGFALDVIVVTPSGQPDDASSFNSSTTDRAALHSSSEFQVQFPIQKQSQIIRIQINGILLKESFLSMILSSSTKTTIFLESQSTKPSSDIVKALVQSRLIRPGKNFLRYILVEKSTRKKGKSLIQDAQHTIQTSIGIAEANLFLWSSTDRIVISDIDGTITKSDVRGVIDSIVTESYGHVHDGVCDFFSNLVSSSCEKKDDNQTFGRHGHTSLLKSEDSKNSRVLHGRNDKEIRILYLSSRPIRLIHSTRKFLNNLCQSSSFLPQGPIFLHSGSLSDVLVTELIKKSTHEFKADVIRRQVIHPFAVAGRQPSQSNTSHGLIIAGFGNKDTDSKAYEMVGISKQSIFIIDPKSRLVNNPHENKQKEEAIVSAVFYQDEDESCCTSGTSFLFCTNPFVICAQKQPSSKDDHSEESDNHYNDNFQEKDMAQATVHKHTPAPTIHASSECEERIFLGYTDPHLKEVLRTQISLYTDRQNR